MQNTTTEASPRQAQVAVLLAVLGGALALVALGTMVLRTHSIHAWSDPVNWLTFARNLPTELFTNRFACGYALFLRLILPITGPYWVFLSNLPIIVAVIASAGGVAAVLTPGPPAQKAASALFTIALATVFDPWLVQVMTNPYRDPLSHLFLFGSLLFAARELPHQPWRASRLFVAGLLLGLAYSVREPALLVAIPLAALMIMRARPAGARTLARAAGWALAGALMGALPLLVQSLLREGGGGLLPPQTLAEHRWLP
ncbi:MAG TPA: hypothetical protein PLP04_20360, partial [Bryobacteraceae bacterium]|nr:hypothetical protein [Bryobacteraceae bacterium]